jgi:hypothetical protein
LTNNMRVMDCFNLRWVSGFLGTNRLMGWNMKLGMIYEVRFTIKPLKITNVWSTLVYIYLKKKTTNNARVVRVNAT